MIVEARISTALNPQAVDYWKQERLIIRFDTQIADTVAFWSALHGTEADPIAVYITVLDSGAHNIAEIDVTDYVRAYASQSGGNLLLYFKQANQGGTPIYYYISVSVVGLINPKGVFIPDQPLADLGMIIAPPTKILHIGNGNDGTRLEVYIDNNYEWQMASGSQAVLAQNNRAIYNITGDFALIDEDGQRHDFYPSPLVCGRYARVRWISFTGVLRQSIFEVVKSTNSSSDNYELLNLDNAYNEIKGREDSLDLYLDDLLAYDLWYYGDVITSSKVEVSLDGQNWFRVQITNKNITIPTWNSGNGKLQITANWKKYDAVTM